MQTFLPYKSFAASAKCLDNRRLGKQRIEAWQIYQALTLPKYGWKHHPAVRMWKGYEPALCSYGWYICNEWKYNRGFNDTIEFRFIDAMFDMESSIITPPWLNDSFCNSHRSNLLRKDPKWYSQFNWQVPDNLPYIWPVK